MTSGSRRVGFEIKLSATPMPSRGFRQAGHDLALDRADVVAPVRRRYALSEDVAVLPVLGLQDAMGEYRPAL